MWRLWKAKTGLCCSYSKYYDVFSQNFNLGFGKPRVDICLKCVELKNKIQNKIELEESRTALKLHRIRAKKFCAVLEESRRKRDTLTVVFDMQQNQPLPRINIGEAYYKRQLWLYNLAFVIHQRNRHQPKRAVRFYTWLESDSGKGSNEVCSTLMDFLRRVSKNAARRGYKHLHLFSDSCPAENKNLTMIGTLLSYMNSSNSPFKTCRITFPIRGHSYLPPDQVFGRVEKEYRRYEVMKMPKSYHNILERHGIVRHINSSWQVKDYKNMTATMLKSNTIPILDTRTWIFTKNSPYVWHQKLFSSEPIKYDLRKASCRSLKVRPQLLKNLNHVSLEKRDDVMELLAFIDLTARCSSVS